MTIVELCSLLNAEVQVAGTPDKEIKCVIAGDLLSFIMGEAVEGSVWITIQTHLNVAAVAVLKEMPMIIIASGRKASPELVARCEEEGICVAVCSESMYGVCRKLSELGLEG